MHMAPASSSNWTARALRLAGPCDLAQSGHPNPVTCPSTSNLPSKNHCVCKLKFSYHIKDDNFSLTPGQRDCDDVRSSLFAIFRNFKKFHWIDAFHTHAIYFSPGREHCLHILNGKCQTGKWSWTWRILWGCGEQVKIGYESSMIITESWLNTLNWDRLRVVLSSISLPNTRLQHVSLATITWIRLQIEAK